MTEMTKKFRIAAVTMAAVGTIALSSLSVCTAYARTLSDDSFTQVAGTMLYVSPQAAATQSVQIAEYQALPQIVIDRLTARNCKIYVETMAEEGGYLPGNGAVAGKFHNGSFTVSAADHRQILGITEANSIDLLADPDAQMQGLVFIHEVGHFVDANAYGGWEANAVHHVASSKTEWQSIYAQEGAAIGSLSSLASVNVYSAKEAFATAFAHYVLTPDALQAACPATYAYMERSIASLQ